jgi:prepilin-type N-terminal cleavage/methylation domain-containing protein
MRRGLTLIELLVVIIILSTLVAAAIPIMAPSNDARRISEASRMLSSYIYATQAKAIGLQRPVGIEIKRLSADTESHDDNAVSVEVFRIEEPAHYHGFDRTSGACVARHPNQNGLALLRFVVSGTGDNTDDLPVGLDDDLFPPGFSQPGDVIECGGVTYRLLPPSNLLSDVLELDANGFYQPRVPAVMIEARPLNDTGQLQAIDFDNNGNKLRDPLPTGTTRPAPFWTRPHPYSIRRQPARSNDAPLQLPEGTAIDLRGSSVGRDQFFYLPSVRDNIEPIRIMFAPEGAISRVLVFNAPTDDSWFDQRVSDDVYLLVGRRELAPPVTAAEDKSLQATIVNASNEQQLQELREANWLLGESQWVHVRARDGGAKAIENAFVPLESYSVSAPAEFDRTRQILHSREFMTSGASDPTN